MTDRRKNADQRFPLAGKANAKSTFCLATLSIDGELAKWQKLAANPKNFPTFEYIVRLGWFPKSDLYVTSTKDLRIGKFKNVKFRLTPKISQP